MQEQTQVDKKRFVFEQYRKTSQKTINVRKKQFESFETSAKEMSFQIISFCFQFWMVLLLPLKSITRIVTM